MMDFLDNLFSYEYFGPILFAVIAILIVLFFIILFFGKKEEKERILEETRRLELANLNAFKEESEEETKIEIKEKEELKPSVEIEEEKEKIPTVEKEDKNEIEEEKQNEESVELDTPILEPISELPLITEVEAESIEDKDDEEISLDSHFTIEPSIPTNLPKYDFEELANSISRELEEIEKISNLKNEETKEEKVEPELKIQEAQVEVTPIKEIKKFKPSPVFSSVFVPKTEESIEEKSKVVENEVKEEIKPVEIPILKQEVKHEEKPVYQDVKEAVKALEKSANERKGIDFSVLKANTTQNIVKPKVDLPKHVDLPKKASDNIIETNVPNFEEIQGESYNISR